MASAAVSWTCGECGPEAFPSIPQPSTHPLGPANKPILTRFFQIGSWLWTWVPGGDKSAMSVVGNSRSKSGSMRNKGGWLTWACSAGDREDILGSLGHCL